jgi:hypothetical protein
MTRGNPAHCALSSVEMGSSLSFSTAEEASQALFEAIEKNGRCLLSPDLLKTNCPRSGTTTCSARMQRSSSKRFY